MILNNFFRGEKVLVTGAGGFIGSHLVESLVEKGARVKAFLHYNSRSDIALLRYLPSENLSEIEILSGDLTDLMAVHQAVEGCSFVFHLGALISIPYSYLHPLEVVKTNVIGTTNVLLACREYGVRRVIHTSTSEVYGTAQIVPIPETHPLQGQSPYSASKIGADKLAESFYRAYNLPVVTVRPFNTYGPRQSMRAVIPTIIAQALKKDTIRLGNLKTTRDFTYVTDTVDGFLRAAMSDDVEGKVYNLGTSTEISIGALAKMIISKTGNAAKIEIDESRLRPDKSEVYRLISDNQSAQSELGWKPENTFEQGIDKTIDWIKQNIDIYKVNEYHL